MSEDTLETPFSLNSHGVDENREGGRIIVTPPLTRKRPLINLMWQSLDPVTLDQRSLKLFPEGRRGTWHWQ